MPEYDEHAAMLEIRDFWADGDQSEEAAFDRWLAARDRENRAIGWDEGFDAGEKDAWDVGTEDHVCTPNPYRGDNR